MVKNDQHKCKCTRVNIGTATLCFASRDLAAGEEVLILLLIVVLVFVLVHLPILPIYIIVVVDVVLLLVFVLVLLLTMRISSTSSFTFSPIQWSLFHSRPCAQCSSSVIFVLIFIVINNLKLKTGSPTYITLKCDRLLQPSNILMFIITIL